MILVYNLSPQREAQLMMLCRKMCLEARTVEKHEYGYRLGYLLGLSDDDTKGDGGDFDGEMLYIAGRERAMMSVLLDQLRRKKLIIPLKAVQTDTNVGFTSAELYRELSAEREAISQGMQAH